MTKTEMVKKLADDWGGISNRQADDNLTALVTFITKTVKKDKELRIPNLGTFRLRQLKRRTGRNPQTGEKITIKARRKVAFTPSKAFKEGILGAPRTAAKKATTSDQRRPKKQRPAAPGPGRRPADKRKGAESPFLPSLPPFTPTPTGYSPSPA